MKKRTNICPFCEQKLTKILTCKLTCKRCGLLMRRDEDGLNIIAVIA